MKSLSVSIHPSPVINATGVVGVFQRFVLFVEAALVRVDDLLGRLVWVIEFAFFSFSTT